MVATKILLKSTLKVTGCGLQNSTIMADSNNYQAYGNASKIRSSHRFKHRVALEYITDQAFMYCSYAN
jgi:hypothetical protein